MLSLKLTAVSLAEEYYIRLKRQLGITIFYLNPLFNDEYEFGEFTNSLQFSTKELNAGSLAGSHLEKLIPSDFFTLDQDFRAEVFKDGIKVVDGKYTFSEITESEYTLNITSGMAKFHFINRKLSELFSQTRTFTTSDELPEHAKVVNAEISSSLYGYVFPQIRNHKFYDNSNRIPDWTGYCNRWDPVNEKFMLNQVVANFVVTGLGLNYSLGAENKDNLVPQFFLLHVLQQIFLNYDYTITGEFIDDPLNHKILIENRYSLDDFKMPYGYFAMHRNASGSFSGTRVFNASWLTKVIDMYFYQEGFAPFRIKIRKKGIHKIRAKWALGTFDAGTYYKEVIVAGSTVYSETFDPMDFNTWTCSFDYTATDADINSEIIFQIRSAGNYELLGNTDYNNPDTYLRIDMPYGLLNGVNDHSNVIDGSKCMPDCTLSELLNAMKKTFGLNIYPSGRFVIFERIKSKLDTGSQIDYTAQADRAYSKKADSEVIDFLSYEWPEDDSLSEKIITELPAVDYTELSIIDLPAATENVSAFVENERAIYRAELIGGTYQWVFDRYYYPEINVNPYNPNINEEPQYRMLGAPPVMMTSKNYTGYATAIMPHTEMKGSAAGELSENSRSLIRFLHWHGLQPNENGEDYPLATSLGRDLSGTEVFPGLYWGPLLSLYWGQWLYIINKGYTWSRKLYLDLSQLIRFSPTDPFHLQNLECYTKRAEINISSEKKYAEVDIEYYDNLS